MRCAKLRCAMWIGSVGFGLLCGLGTVQAAGTQTEQTYSPATSLPAERVADSYSIYRQVLPSNAIEWSDVERSQWLVQNTTTAEPLGSRCSGAEMTNPHHAITAPRERATEWAEVLADFDAHCHERYTLHAAELQMKLPVHLLDAEAQSRYWKGVAGFRPPANNIMQAPPTPNEFKGAAGLHTFSAVYFNQAHTLAAVNFGMGCGSLCGNWVWVVLEKTAAGWHRLPWVTFATFS